MRESILSSIRIAIYRWTTAWHAPAQTSMGTLRSAAFSSSNALERPTCSLPANTSRSQLGRYWQQHDCRQTSGELRPPPSFLRICPGCNTQDSQSDSDYVLGVILNTLNLNLNLSWVQYSRISISISICPGCYTQDSQSDSEYVLGTILKTRNLILILNLSRVQ